ncbi:MAG: rhodanese-like domain-containing protein [Gammaproteobacteria bacterium]
MGQSVRDFSATQLHTYLSTANTAPRLLDVREPWEYDIAHLKGSELVPLKSIPGKLERFDPEQEMVVICHHGIRSMQVCRYLASLGFTHLINLRGGVNAWARDIDRLMSTY